jgi:hypothetical protein
MPRPLPDYPQQPPEWYGGAGGGGGQIQPTGVSSGADRLRQLLQRGQ